MRIREDAEAAVAGEEAAAKAAAFGRQREWTWCAWRDEVISKDGRRSSMKRSLAGRLDWVTR